ncbi:FAD-dependent monooxygenase [Streptomyces camelliae]|uniref:FAD-dependent monooxygenase n=1 Tax=Streptomyces camelliae TaxID=3004093 RepID=UPI003D16940E
MAMRVVLLSWWPSAWAMTGRDLENEPADGGGAAFLGGDAEFPQCAAQGAGVRGPARAAAGEAVPTGRITSTTGPKPPTWSAAPGGGPHDRERRAGMSADVIVSGAGPVGLLTAALLDSAGVKVEVIERLTERSKNSRAAVLPLRGLEVLTTVRVEDVLNHPPAELPRPARPEPIRSPPRKCRASGLPPPPSRAGSRRCPAPLETAGASRSSSSRPHERRRDPRPRRS